MKIRKKTVKTRIHALVWCLISCILFGFTCCSRETDQTAEKRSRLIQPSKWWEKLPRPVYAILERVETSQEWFEVYALTPDTYAIYEPFQFEEAISFLATGKEGAVVIDTGTGIGDLKQVVSELTELPVSVVNTHTHWDHIGSNSQFEHTACFNHKDCIRKLREGLENAQLLPSVSGDSVWKPLPEGFDAATWSIPPVEPTTLLEDGDLIPLGERTLEVISTPGHSPGSICLLDRKNRILFTGDTFFPGPLYAYPEDVNVDDYIASLKKLNDLIDEYDYLCSGHNDPWVKSEVIARVVKAFHDILDGKGKYKEDKGIRRYYFDGFDILIRSDMIKK
ncbi:MAG: MBL fold metallo-hydrolase [Candidatus Aminicenantes bacterium]|jgi:glyoxylase-like metal-dependent hydrolase (beta-lactamase superfamily II)